jgi:hypothetical protein
MVAPGNVDKHRRRMSGLKVEETEKWGNATAYERYGKPQQPDMKAKDMSQPQDPQDKRGPGWQNDTPNNWLRGANEDGRPPNFDKGKR